MKSSKSSNPQPNLSKFRLTPERLGMITLIACALLVWAGYFWLSDGWSVKEEARNQKGVLDHPQPNSAEKIKFGPQMPQASRSFYNYSERLEEQSALLIALTVTALHENLAYRRNPQDLPTLINQARARHLSETEQLWLPMWDKNARINEYSGWILTSRSLNYLYYRPQPFGLEIMTVSLNGDPQITVARLPERSGSALKVNPEFVPEGISGAALYVSPGINAKLLPPWSSTETFEQWGWHREPLKVMTSSPERRADINRWVAGQTASGQ